MKFEFPEITVVTLRSEVIAYETSDVPADDD